VAYEGSYLVMPVDIIENALKEGRSRLSEYESKKLLASYGLPVTREALINHPNELGDAAAKIGYPLVVKACSAEVAHKTEQGLIRVDVRNDDEALAACAEIMLRMKGKRKSVLLQQMISGKRELMMGLKRDQQFGPCVMFGLGGIFAEVLNDTTFRIAPLEKHDALQMLQEIRAHKILQPVRGLKDVDRDRLAEMLMTVGQIGIEHEMIKEIDINPVIVSSGKPVAVDALVGLQHI
jgi:acetyl-CoA synthetase (ADP-forming)